MTKPIEDFKDRLKKALDIKEIKPIELSERTKIPISSISQYLSGYTNPRIDRIDLIAKSMNLNPSWLLGFDVPMEATKTQEAAKTLNEISKNKRLMEYLTLLMDQSATNQNEAIEILGLVVKKNQQLEDIKKE